MTKVKGCVNYICSAYEKKVTYKESEDFCSRCGQKLVHVCKKCYTPIDSSKKYCDKCKERRDNRNKKIKKAVVSAGSVALTVGGVVLTKGKNISKRVANEK